MKHILRSAALLLVFGCVSASALDSQGTAAITQAADSFAVLAGDSAHNGKPPRLTDPAAKALLDPVFNTADIESGGVFPMSELQNLNNRTLAVLKVGLIYTLAGSGYNDLNALPNDPATAAKVNQNAVLFAPEMGRYFDAEMRISAAIMDTVSAFITTATHGETDRPNFKSGLAQMRTGYTQLLAGVLTTLPTPGVADQWRRDRLTVLLATAPRAIKFFMPEQLQQLRETATAVSAEMKDPGVKAALASVVQALTLN
jgi:hypothetical protein